MYSGYTPETPGERVRKEEQKNDNKRTERGKRVTITTAGGRTGKPLTMRV